MNNISKTLLIVFLILSIISIIFFSIASDDEACKTSIVKCYNVVAFDSNTEVSCLDSYDYTDMVCTDGVTINNGAVVLSYLSLWACVFWLILEV